MSEETWSADELAQQILATMDSVGIVERVRAVEETDRTEDEVDELARNERHIQLKMAITQFVSGLSVDEKAKTISKGMVHANNSFCSIKIFFTAGSSSHAIPEVLPATIIDKIRATKILFKCFFTYSLNSFFNSNFSSSNFILKSN